MRISDWSSDVCSSDLDVAAIAGVSPITASRVVSGKMNVDSELAARVRSAVDTLGYRPDPSARALASAKSTHVVVLVPMLSNTLFTDLLEAIQESMWKAGYQVFVGITHYQRSEKRRGGKECVITCRTR